ncbi:MAG: phage antirepressor KilAC domain-containing protein [Oscillospiraceae bacterium]
MNEIQIFSNPEFGEIRTLEIDGEMWVVGKDVCEAFGDTNHNRSLSRIDEVDKKVMPIQTKGGMQNTIFINESGLYSLLFAMQPQKAHNNGVQDEYPLEIQRRIDKLHKFKFWVTHEVLPSIRKHGVYMTRNFLENDVISPDLLIQLALQMKTEQGKIKALEQKIESDKPKLIFADAVTASQTSILIGELAKILVQNGIATGQNRLFSWMRDNGYLIGRKGTDYNMPTQIAMQMGLFEIKETVITHSDGHTSISKTPKVTGKGQIYFTNLFLSELKKEDEIKQQED